MAELYVPRRRKLCGECHKALVPLPGSATAESCKALGVCFPCFDRVEAREVPESRERRREAEVAKTETRRPTCAHCGKGLVPDSDNQTAKAARGLSLCYQCYSTPEIRGARRAEVGGPSKPGHDTASATLAKDGSEMCAHCGTRAVATGESSHSRAAEKLSLCSTCYSDADVKKARRKAIGAPERGPITPTRSRAGGRTTRTKPRPSSPPDRIPKERQLAAPAAGPVAKRKRRTGPPTPAATDRGDLRSAIDDVLQEGFARYAIRELRAVADHMEDELES